MTMAVCYKCGDIKFGAFVPCPKCNAFPGNEDDLALSLAMTDHYFDMPTLEKMGEAIKNGQPPQLDPETHQQLVADLRSSGMVEKMRAMSRDWSGEEPLPEQSKPKKPWWQFW
jgi:hypothetical protein